MERLGKKKKSLGIIGFGRFGQLLAKFLKMDFNVVVHNKSDKHKEAQKIGVRFESLDKVSSSEIVIFCVPISALESAVREAKQFIRTNALVMDVCSVKTLPCKIMEEILPKEVEIIGTHPLFGPTSAKFGLEGKKIVLCPVRTTRLKEAEKLFSDRNLEVILVSPEEHDKQISSSLNLIHLIGRALINQGVNDQEIDTPNFRKLLEIKKSVESDTIQLFQDMNKFNPFAKEIMDSFSKEIEKVKSVFYPKRQ